MSSQHDSANSVLDTILADFNVSRNNGKSMAKFSGAIPSPTQTSSHRINLTLVGAVPSLANALLAAQILEARGGPAQEVMANLQKSHNYIDPDIGMTPSINGQEIPLDVILGNPFLRNIFETKDGRHVVLSAVYVDLVYKWTALLKCSVLEADVRNAVKKWNSEDLEAVAAKAGMPMAIVQSEETWAASPHGKHLAKLPIVPVDQRTSASPKPFPTLSAQGRPLEGIKVLCCTHAIAGPSAGRTLAEHGASVLQIMFTHGFEHHFVYMYANLGCASARLNLHKQSDREQLMNLVRDADVWIDSYREGAIARFGFSNEDLFRANPSLIVSHVRCYGTTGPWAGRPGFDMQGSASSGLMAVCGDGLANPAWPPGMVINDYTTGYYGALAIQAALLRRMEHGGGYVLSPSLTGTAMSILKHFKTSQDAVKAGEGSAVVEALPPDSLEGITALGYLKTLKPLPEMSATPIRYDPILAVPMGSSIPVFPGDEDKYDLKLIEPRKREHFLTDVGLPYVQKLYQLRALHDSSSVEGVNSSKV